MRVEACDEEGKAEPLTSLIGMAARKIAFRLVLFARWYSVMLLM